MKKYKLYVVVSEKYPGTMFVNIASFGVSYSGFPIIYTRKYEAESIRKYVKKYKEDRTAKVIPLGEFTLDKL